MTADYGISYERTVQRCIARSQLRQPPIAAAEVHISGFFLQRRSPFVQSPCSNENFLLCVERLQLKYGTAGNPTRYI